LHGATFDITNGKVTGEPAEDDVKGYNVIFEGEDIKIEE
jgi:nitrite reductase/ring-hydroxylating ferredoxin subunit